MPNQEPKSDYSSSRKVLLRVLYYAMPLHSPPTTLAGSVIKELF